MSEVPALKYGTEDFVEEDFKRLRRWKSLRSDILGQYEIICGLLKEVGSYPPSNEFCGGLITFIKHSKGSFHCFKDRVPILDPEMTPAEGARVVFAIIPELAMFVPLLVYGAFEEGTMYRINGKKYPLARPGLGKIINEKLKRLSR